MARGGAVDTDRYQEVADMTDAVFLMILVIVTFVLCIITD